MADERVSGFSQGMRQRVAIARTLLRRAELLLLDEPYAGLDGPAREVVDRAVLAVRDAGRTVVLATHDPTRAALATRTVLIEAGRLHPGPVVPRPSGVPRRAAATLACAAAAAAGVAPLRGALGDRHAGQAGTGEAVTGAAAPAGAGAAPLEDLERRVRARPDDVTAHLSLAERYLGAGRLREATLEYLAAVKVDPGNVEAKTRLGLLLFQSGLPEPGLRSVEQALAADPRYPEALYAKGLILSMGMRQPEAAIPSLRAYLEVAPFGAHRDLVEQLLDLATASPGSTPPPRSAG